MTNREDYFDRDTRRIELNDDVDTISSIIGKTRWRYKYFATLTFPQEPDSYWDGTSQFVFFHRKYAEKYNTHLLPIFAIEPNFHRFGIHQILLSEQEINETEYRREWMKRKNPSSRCFGVGGLSSMDPFNPSRTGVGYIFERHIQHVIGRVFCPRKKRCKARCRCGFPFEGLTDRENDSRIIRALKH